MVMRDWALEIISDQMKVQYSISKPFTVIKLGKIMTEKLVWNSLVSGQKEILNAKFSKQYNLMRVNLQKYSVLNI